MATVATLGERGLIERIRRRVRVSRWVEVGPGDDAAVLRWSSARQRLLFASDLLIEGTHFTRRRTAPRWIGWKALARNVSDIAAMGGEPCYAVVSLGLPPSTPLAFVDGLYDGLRRCAKAFDVDLVGGDTVRAPRVVIDVAIIGRVAPSEVVLRSGARVGDRLFVTGRLGGSLRSGRHATFMPRVAQARWLVTHLPLSAMIDLSDGLASDAWQIARASRATLRLEAARIPMTRAARTRQSRVSRGGQALQHALMDGEDFELLFAVPPSAAHRVPRAIARVPVTAIGRVVARGAGVELEYPNGTIRTLTPRGFRHF